MSGEIEACASGCTVTEGDEVYYRAADVGHFCHSCVARIRARLDEAPRILAVLRASVAGIRAVDTTSQRVDGTRDAPIPLDADMLETADDLFAGVCNWAMSHAQTMGVTGGLPTWLARLADAGMDASHLPTVSSPQEAAQRLREVAEWLVKWGDTIAHTIPAPSLADYHEWIVDTVRKARGRAGLSERAPRIRKRGYMCGVCGASEGEADVPDVGPVVFRCASCHAIYPAPELEMRKAA